jgi:1-phosphofructokinase family hexose kinase
VAASLCHHIGLIVTLTVNPAIDRTITVDRLAFEDRAYILSTHDTPGGRGINASSVIHAFGGQTRAILPAGGNSGKHFQLSIEKFGFPMTVVPIRSEVRTNLTITDRQGLTVKLNERGHPMSQTEVSAIEKTVRQNLSGMHWLMLCGSLPPGVPSTFYAKLIRAAHKEGVKTLLDTEGEALQAGIQAKPTVVSPNQEEAERLLDTALITRSHTLEAVERIRAMGARSVLLSLGSRGAIGFFQGAILEAVPPHVDVRCPIGAGDAMCAAFLWALENNEPHQSALRWGVAAGTASAMQPGMKFADLAQTREMYGRIAVHSVE